MYASWGGKLSVEYSSEFFFIHLCVCLADRHLGADGGMRDNWRVTKWRGKVPDGDYMVFVLFLLL